MASFTDVVSGIEAALKADTALADFCRNHLGRSLTVSTQFRQRTEVPQSKLPIIILTRPSIEKTFLNNNVLDGRHTMRLYAGFYQQDHRAALADLVVFEELIEDALWRIVPDTIGAMSITPKASVNDEGYMHPTYFLGMDVEIQHRRFKP